MVSWWFLLQAPALTAGLCPPSSRLPPWQRSVCIYTDLCGRKMKVSSTPPAPQGSGLCFDHSSVPSSRIEPDTN